MSDSRNAYRSVVKEAVTLLVKEAGFTHAEEEPLETMVEMLISLMNEIAQQTRNYSELAGRTQAVVGDVLMALINLGVEFKDLDKYAFRENRPVARNMNTNQAQKPLQILQAGTKPSNPVHIPSYLPPLPDPHAYVRTATYKQPETEYETIREKSANQKRDIEKALTKFLAKTCAETHNLFDNEEVQMFPLISSKPSVPPYLSALNPTDQCFDFEELEYYYQVANRKPDNEEVESENEEKREEEEIPSPPKKRKNKKSGDMKKEPESTTTTRPTTPIEQKQIQQPEQEKVIDNPFLKLKRVST